MPHKVTLPDGRTCYYNGTSVFPLYVVNPDGTGYWGLGATDTPEFRAMIARADKRAYVGRA